MVQQKTPCVRSQGVFFVGQVGWLIFSALNTRAGNRKEINVGENQTTFMLP